MLIKAFGKIKKKTVFFFLLNLCVNHSVLSFFSFLCENLLLQKRVQSLCEITVFLCANLIDPSATNPTLPQHTMAHGTRVPNIQSLPQANTMEQMSGVSDPERSFV